MELEQRLKAAIEADKLLSPEQRAVNAARQRRGYVVSEMMFGTDAQEATGKDAMTREEAERRYDATDAGALLAGYERLLADTRAVANAVERRDTLRCQLRDALSELAECEALLRDMQHEIDAITT